MCSRAFKRPQDLKKHEKLHQEGGAKSGGESGAESRRGSSASVRDQRSNSGSGAGLRVPQSMADLKRSKRSPSFSSAASSVSVSPHPSPLHPPSPASDWSDPGTVPGMQHHFGLACFVISTGFNLNCLIA